MAEDILKMAGGVGLEPTVRVLETRGLPINRPAYIKTIDEL